MHFSKAKKLYTESAEAQGFEPAEITERLSKEMASGGWMLKRLDSPMNFSVLAAIVWGDSKVTCGPALTAYLARQQRQAIDARIFAEQTLPSLCKSHGVSAPEPIQPQKPIPKPKLQQHIVPPPPPNGVHRK